VQAHYPTASVHGQFAGSRRSAGRIALAGIDGTESYFQVLAVGYSIWLAVVVLLSVPRHRFFSPIGCSGS
jgi:uncharacterized RDD family membrane protein YckC